MSKATPGPWSFSTEPQPNGCPIIGARGLMVAMLAHSVRQADQKDEAEANARLIAAAPELLAALELALVSLDARGAIPSTMMAVRAAIAKATEAQS